MINFEVSGIICGRYQSVLAQVETVEQAIRFACVRPEEIDDLKISAAFIYNDKTRAGLVVDYGTHKKNGAWLKVDTGESFPKTFTASKCQVRSAVGSLVA
jgi:hypothetical protein